MTVLMISVSVFPRSHETLGMITVHLVAGIECRWKKLRLELTSDELGLAYGSSRLTVHVSNNSALGTISGMGGEHDSTASGCEETGRDGIY